MASHPRLTVVIVSFQVASLLRVCLDALQICLEGEDAEVWVVDNASTDGSSNMVEKEFPHIKLIRNPDNRGFAAAVNQVLHGQRGQYILLLNPDAVINGRALTTLLGFLNEHREAGVVGPRLVDAEGCPQPSVGSFPSLRLMMSELGGLSRFFPGPRRCAIHPNACQHPQGPHMVDWVCGACMVVRQEAVAEVGLLDEEFFFYGEDVDWCKRFRSAGWSVWYVPMAEVVHLGGRSVALAVPEGTTDAWHAQACWNDIVYFRKHRGRLAAGIVRGMYLAFGVLGWARSTAMSAMTADHAFSDQARFHWRRVRHALKPARRPWCSTANRLAVPGGPASGVGS